MWKEAVVAYFNSQPIHVVTGENCENVISDGHLGSEAWIRGARMRSGGAEQTNVAFSCEVLAFAAVGLSSPSGMWRRITGWLVPDFAKEPIAYVLEGSKCLNVGQFLEDETTTSSRNAWDWL